MNSIVLYYSLTGTTKPLAEDFARANGLAVCEVRTPRKLSSAAAYTAGIVKAIKGRGMPIAPPAIPLGSCEAAHIFAPVWADSIAPPMNSAIALLPKDCALHLHMVSASGKSDPARVKANLQRMGYTVASYEDLKK